MPVMDARAFGCALLAMMKGRNTGQNSFEDIEATIAFVSSYIELPVSLHFCASSGRNCSIYQARFAALVGLDSSTR